MMQKVSICGRAQIRLWFAVDIYDFVEEEQERGGPQILGVSNFCVLGHPDHDP